MRSKNWIGRVLLGMLVLIFSGAALSLEHEMARVNEMESHRSDKVMTEHHRLTAGADHCRARNVEHMSLYNSYVRRHAEELRSVLRKSAGTSTKSALTRIEESAVLEAMMDYAGYCDRSFKSLQTVMATVETGRLSEYFLSGEKAGTRIATR